MAALSRDPKSKIYRILFRFGGRQFHKSLKTKDKSKAEALKGKIENSLHAIEEGWVNPVPASNELWPYLFSGGKMLAKPSVADVLSLDKLFNRYEQEMPPGSMEENSLNTIRLHKNHLLGILGSSTDARSVTTTELQRYVNVRAKEKYRKKPISPRTIKKEVATFRAVWNWARLHSLLTQDAPTRGLKYEKEAERIPFLTWEEIEHRVKLAPDQARELWDALFLSRQEIAELLEQVKEAPALSFVYPMFVFVAHTGARRSEMIRSRVEDFDFVARRVCIREKKRDRSKKETRRYVRMTPLLERVMKSWLTDEHPGGPHTFCHGEYVSRSRKRSRMTGYQGKNRPTTSKGRLASVRARIERLGPGQLTRTEARHHFKKALGNSKWSVVRGFHVFRHSFASNLAAAGIRQEIIDEMMGHLTEDMRKRYRHLFPHETTDALQKVFG